MRKTALFMAMLMCISTVSAAAAEEVFCRNENGISVSIVRVDTAKQHPRIKAVCNAYVGLNDSRQIEIDFPPEVLEICEVDTAFYAAESERIFHIRE